VKAQKASPVPELALIVVIRFAPGRPCQPRRFRSYEVSEQTLYTAEYQQTADEKQSTHGK
jgi:hypothetical protein